MQSYSVYCFEELEMLQNRRSWKTGTVSNTSVLWRHRAAGAILWLIHSGWNNLQWPSGHKVCGTQAQQQGCRWQRRVRIRKQGGSKKQTDHHRRGDLKTAKSHQMHLLSGIQLNGQVGNAVQARMWWHYSLVPNQHYEWIQTTTRIRNVWIRSRRNHSRG